jgi:hypothetical protein
VLFVNVVPTVFAKSGGVNNQPLGQLAVRALDEWKNVKQVFIIHIILF